MVNARPLYLTTFIATAVPTPSIDVAPNITPLTPRVRNATGCVQAHCTTIQETLLTPKALEYQIYWNAQLLFNITGKPSSSLEWRDLSDPQGRKWGIFSVGDCESLSYINNFQEEYEWYELTRTQREESRHDCGPCLGRRQKCGTCRDYEAVFSDGESGECYGYEGLGMCDFKVRC